MNYAFTDSFDFISLIGVLQKTSVLPGVMIERISTLLQRGGHCFITTKNIQWNKFDDATYELNHVYRKFSTSNNFSHHPSLPPQL